MVLDPSARYLSNRAKPGQKVSGERELHGKTLFSKVFPMMDGCSWARIRCCMYGRFGNDVERTEEYLKKFRTNGWTEARRQPFLVQYFEMFT